MSRTILSDDDIEMIGTTKRYLISVIFLPQGFIIGYFLYPIYMLPLSNVTGKYR